MILVSKKGRYRLYGGLASLPFEQAQYTRAATGSLAHLEGLSLPIINLNHACRHKSSLRKKQNVIQPTIVF